MDMTDPERKTKGALTSERILDAAEIVFSEAGFEGSSLREIARRAGIHQPGIYNHFDGKRELYAAVLDRALKPMLEAMQDAMTGANPLETYSALPGIMTDQLMTHPRMAALFHQALQSDGESIGGQMIGNWLDRLFSQGMETLDSASSPSLGRREMAIRIIAMFNLTTGYFLSQRAFSSLVHGDDDLTSPENIALQKRLLARLVRSLLSE
jgi:AcrR family transcriptional regulator